MRRLLKPASGTLAAALLLAGCAVGDNYERPAIDLPASFRGADTDTRVDGDRGLARGLHRSRAEQTDRCCTGGEPRPGERRGARA
jgi:hypothetical protein